MGFAALRHTACEPPRVTCENTSAGVGEQLAALFASSLPPCHCFAYLHVARNMAS